MENKMKAVVRMKNLMFRTRIEEILKGIGISVLDEDEKEFDLQILSLNDEGSFELLEENPRKTIAICPHVMTEKFEKGKQLGCENIYANSYFFINFQKILENFSSKQ